MGGLRGRDGFEFAQKIRADAVQRNEGKEPKPKLEVKAPAIEVVDRGNVHVISVEEADDARALAEKGYPGSTESEKDVN